MFYTEVVFAHKGPLGKVWLAAHFDKKLSKNQIFSTDITQSVKTVLNPSTMLALRVSGHLMVGIVRIYSKKMKYLMVDCSEAMWKIKLALKPGQVDIDPMVAPNIDDNRNYGNLIGDVDFPMLENIYFGDQLLPTLSISRLGYLDEDSVFTETDSLHDDVGSFSTPKFTNNALNSYSSMVSDPEEVRGTSRISPFIAKTTPPIPEDSAKQQCFQPTPYDDNLPQFEENFDVYISGSLPIFPSLSIDPIEISSIKKPLNEANLTNRTKQKQKVQIDERIQAVEFVQHSFHPNLHLRQNVKTSSCTFRTMSDQSLEKDFFCKDLCSELVEVVDTVLGGNVLKFPTKKQRVETIDGTRSGTPEKTRAVDTNELVNNSISFDGGIPFSQEHFFGLNESICKDPIYSPVEFAHVGFDTNASENLFVNPELSPVGGDKKFSIQKHLSSDKKVEFDVVLADANKADAAKSFLELLSLKSQNVIHLQQDFPFGAISVIRQDIMGEGN